MCGEYKNLFLLLDTNMGSPPHVWRILSCSSELFSALGITSTYVENTKPNTCHIDPHGDHLHIRGEYCCFIAFGFSPPGITSTYVENTHPGGYKTKKIIGSPPHTWRIHLQTENSNLKNGITSTYVENTVLHNPFCDKS